MKYIFWIALLFYFPSMLLADGVTRGHPADCTTFSDMALTARALAVEGVPKEKTTAIFAVLYDMSLPLRSDIAAQILKAAYTTQDKPAMFAGRLRFFCERQGGEMSQVFTKAPSM